MCSENCNTLRRRYSTLHPNPVDFNETLCSAIDETIVEVLGDAVLVALYSVLEDRYAITRDELAYRTDTLFQVLETTFGFRGAKTLGNRIAQKLYRQLDLAFHDREGYTLLDYVEDAKEMLARSPPCR